MGYARALPERPASGRARFFFVGRSRAAGPPRCLRPPDRRTVSRSRWARGRHGRGHPAFPFRTGTDGARAHSRGHRSATLPVAWQGRSPLHCLVWKWNWAGKCWNAPLRSSPNRALNHFPATLLIKMPSPERPSVRRLPAQYELTRKDKRPARSSNDGGNPVRSRWTRRSQSAGAAAGWGISSRPPRSIARMASMDEAPPWRRSALFGG